MLWQVKGETKLNRNKVGLTYKSPFYLPDIGEDIIVSFDVWLKLK